MKFVIEAGHLIDGYHEEVKTNQFIYIEGNRISAVSAEKRTDHGDYRVIDAHENCVIPGIVDAHKHIFNNGGAGVGVGMSLMQIMDNMQGNLYGGVTTLLDLGGPWFIKWIAGIPFANKPRIYYAGPIITCKGGYPIEYMNPRFYKIKSVIECANKSEIDAAIRWTIGNGASVIKTAVVSRTFDGRPQIMWEKPLLQHLVDETHAYGLQVCAHITYANDYHLAIECGIDSIHHAAYDEMKDGDLKEMAEKGTIFVPTLSLIDLMATGLSEGWVYKQDFKPRVNKAIRQNLVEFTKNFELTRDEEPIPGLFIKRPKTELLHNSIIAINNLKKFISYGGTVALGTDAALGFSFHETPVRELELLMLCGLNLPQTIKAASYQAARVVSRENDLGSITNGKLADILVVDKGILQDIRKVSGLRYIMKGGKFFQSQKSQ